MFEPESDLEGDGEEDKQPQQQKLKQDIFIWGGKGVARGLGGVAMPDLCEKPLYK